MNFIIYDISFLALFIIFVSIFLYKRRNKIKKEGLLLLYRTKKGIKIINNIGNKYKKTLQVLSYISIILGYFLMGAMIYLFGKIVWVYLFQPNIVRIVKVPPIMPLIPYLPQIFKLDFLPPFYFTYWIIIIAIIAITHEFAHGIFAAHKKVKIKNTGFGFFPFFLPIFFAAFVELDEKKMSQKSKFSQLSILSAGTFANVLVAIFFFLILLGFFNIAFIPSGVTFDSYSYSIVPITKIELINGVPLENISYEGILNLLKDGYNQIEANGRDYLLTKSFLKQQKNNENYLVLYDNSPAINSELKGAIKEINGVAIDSKKKFVEELMKYSPGEKIDIVTKFDNETLKYEIVLGSNPKNESVPWLGVGFIERKGILNKVINFIKKENVYYEAKFVGGIFIYNLLLWLTIISISVALINMLPIGIFDGGKFLFLTALAITKNEKKAKGFFNLLTYIILFLFFLIMIFWFLTRFKTP